MSNNDLRFPSSAAKQQYYKNRKKILANQNVCAICGGEVDTSLPAFHPLSPEVDHKIPISKGGHASSMDNLQLVHRRCNQAKTNKLPPEERSDYGLNPETWLNW